MSRRDGNNPFKNQLGGFLRGALEQLDSVRAVVTQKSRQGKIQLELTLLRRKKKDALARLGATVAELIDDGRLSEDDYPDLGGALAELEAVEQKIAVEQQRAHAASAGTAGASSDFAAAQPPTWPGAEDFTNDPRDQFDDDDPEDDLAAYAEDADDLPQDISEKPAPKKPSA